MSENSTARHVIEHALHSYYADGGQADQVVRVLLHNYDHAHRAAVLAEAKTEVVAWLVKKAREGTPVEHLASKVHRGAIRVFPHAEPEKATAPAATATPDFFQPGHTYSREHHGHRIEFRVTAIDTSPDGEQRLARGWRTDEHSDWEPSDSDDLCGWTDVTEAGEPS